MVQRKDKKYLGDNKTTVVELLSPDAKCHVSVFYSLEYFSCRHKKNLTAPTCNPANVRDITPSSI